jgi:predicted DNA-binding protein
MLRMQIQLTDELAEALRRRSERTGRSMAALVRDALEQELGAGDDDDGWERALAAVGRFRSGTGDTSVEHDRTLAEAYAGRLR